MSLLMSLDSACFDKDSLLTMNNGDKQPISKINRDTLLYDGRITSIMKLTSRC